jgi:pyruvate dehydrogenase E1 component alpha subunit
MSAEIDADTAVEMLRPRRFDDAASRLLQMGQIPGVIHLTAGQEGEVVGACMAAGAGDYVVGHHRSHGHPIARGGALGPLLAELMGKATGVSKGKAGSQHLIDPKVGHVLGSAVLGSAVPVAVGMALSSKVKGQGRVIVAFFGDGASNEGAVHESMNLASIWKVPVVFVCENNGYAVSVSSRSALSVEDVAVRAAGYGMPGEIVDGQDAFAVHDTVHAAVERARAGGGPSLVEAKTYRYVDHAENLPVQAYRADEEIESWRARDPIDLLRARLLAAGWAVEADLAALEAEVAAEVEEAVRFAVDSPFPRPDALYEDLFSGAHPVGR